MCCFVAVAGPLVYQERLSSSKLVFKATVNIKDTECCVIVKFSQVWCEEEVLRILSKLGVAPHIHSVKLLLGDWFQIVMEDLTHSYQTLDKCKFSNQEEMAACFAALDQVCDFPSALSC